MIPKNEALNSAKSNMKAFNIRSEHESFAFFYRIERNYFILFTSIFKEINYCIRSNSLKIFKQTFCAEINVDINEILKIELCSSYLSKKEYRKTVCAFIQSLT